VRWAALALAAVILCGCESSAERSAQLEAQAKRRGGGLQKTAATRISTPSKSVKVVASSLVRGTEGDAVVLRLRNTSSSALAGVPVQITVRDSHGASVYTNTTPGLGATLVSAPLIGPHATALWIDDQVTAQGTPASVSALVGEGHPVTGPPPQLAVTGAHIGQEGSSATAEGNLVNHSAATQHELVVDAIATSGARIVAAGRAVVPEAGPGASTPFQLFFVGSPKGGRLLVSAAPGSA
jgi:hypothetical protein